MLGLALMALGKGGMATLVQFLPMPVVGGYLAFIGFFCGQAGLALMAQVI
jgi:sulfate permease, SulP family